MRRLMLSTLALVALALPAAAQERICREPNQAAFVADLGFFRENREKFSDRSRYRPHEIFQFAAWAGEEAFHRSFIEKCKTGEVLTLRERAAPTPEVSEIYRQVFLRQLERYCDFMRPIHQVRDSSICFAQVPPRE